MRPRHPRSAYNTSTTPPPSALTSTISSIATTELFPELRRDGPTRRVFTEEQNQGIEHLLGIVDDVQARHRNAYAKEREMSWYFQPDAHRHVIRDHKVGDWVVVALLYWEALCAVRSALGIQTTEGGCGQYENRCEDYQRTRGDGYGDRAAEVSGDVDANADTDAGRDARYARVVAALKDFVKAFTAIKDKALKDMMQVNKQRYTHIGQWVNFLTLGAGIVIYLKNAFSAGAGSVGAGVGVGVGAIVARSNSTFL